MHFGLHSVTCRGERPALRTLRVTIGLSLLVHVAALSLLPRVRATGPGDEVQLLAGDRLEVLLAAPVRSAPPPPEIAPPSPLVLAPAPRRAKRAAASRSIVRAPALDAPIAESPDQPPPIPAMSGAAPTQIARPPAGDLSAYIAARRRERGEPPSDAGEIQRATPGVNIAANLPTPATGVATQNRRRGGGMFEIRRMNYDDAAFEFFGWNNEMGRKAPQLVEVRIGDNPDMRTAVVRRMIAIIREHSNSDFIWRSPHHEDGVTLSARLQDNGELESFLLHDLFDEGLQSP